MTALGTKDERFAALTAALASAARDGQVAVDDAARVIRHELRQRNKKKALSVVRRSVAAQAVIERYRAEGQPIPTNSSPDALHSDHVFKLSSKRIRQLEGQSAWLAEMPKLCAVVCVTAAENYVLQQAESRGADGWTKYAAVGIELAEPPLSG